MSLLALSACGGSTSETVASHAGDDGGGGGTTCGAAGTPTACVPETVGAVTLSFGGVSSLADDATNVYVADTGGQVQAVDVATGKTTILATLAHSAGNTFLAVAGGDVLVSAGGTVVSVPKSGGKTKTLVSGETGGLGIAATGAAVLWSESYTAGVVGSASGQIFTLPLGGGTPKAIASKLDNPFGPVTDGKNAYWVNDGSIQSVPIEGGTVTTLVSRDPNVLTVVTDGASLYWADDMAQLGSCGVCPPPPAPTSTDSSIYKVPVTGGSKTLLAHGYRIDAVGVDGKNAYWFDATELTLVTVPVAGGTPIVLAKKVSSGVAPLVDTPYVYWISSDNKLMRMAKQPK